MRSSAGWLMRARALWRSSWIRRCRCCTGRSIETQVARMERTQSRLPILLPELVPHPGLDLGHAADPAVVILGLLAHVAEHLGVRQDQKRLLLEAGEHVPGDLLRCEITVAGLRALGDRAQHVGVDALRAENRDTDVVGLVRDREVLRKAD